MVHAVTQQTQCIHPIPPPSPSSTPFVDSICNFKHAALCLYCKSPKPPRRGLGALGRLLSDRGGWLAVLLPILPPHGQQLRLHRSHGGAHHRILRCALVCWSTRMCLEKGGGANIHARIFNLYCNMVHEEPPSMTATLKHL